MNILESMSKDLDEARARVDYLQDTLSFLRSAVKDYRRDPEMGFQVLSTLLFDKKLEGKTDAWVEDIARILTGLKGKNDVSKKNSTGGSKGSPQRP